MGMNFGRKLPSGLVLAVDAANDKCQRQNIFQQYGSVSTSNQNVSFRVNGTGTFQRVGYGQTIGGYQVKPTDVVYSYGLGGTGCHYHGDDIWITQGYYTFTFDYLVTGASNFPTVNYLANLERLIGGSTNCPNSTQNVWQTRRFGGYYSGTGGLIRPLLYPGACSSSYLASSGTLYYRNPELTFSTSSTLGANDSQTTGRTFNAIDTNSRTQMYDLVNPNGTGTFGGVSDNGRPPPSPQGGGSWYFDGTSATGYFTMAGANTHLDNQNYTQEVWVRTNATSQNGFWFEKGQVNTQYSLFQEGGNIVHRTKFTDGTLDSLYTPTASYMNTSDWYHVVATYDGSIKRTYINGVLVSSKSISKTIAVNSNGVWIGKYGGGGGYQYNGYLAKCNIYNRALNSTEINNNFELDKERFGY